MTQRPSESDERATARPVHLPTVLAVGCSNALLARCWDAIAPLGVMVRDCDVRGLPTLVATRQPLAIVMPRALYVTDPEEFEALARDVRASLIQVDERADDRELEATLSLAVRATMRRRDGRPGSGRYSILPGDPLDGPRSARSEPPTSGTRPAVLTLDRMEEELLAALR
jgi:hypothetical protein